MGIPNEVMSLDIDNAQVACKPNIQGWIEAAQRNPAPDEYFVMQINSFEDLQKRAESSQEQASRLKERLTKT